MLASCSRTYATTADGTVIVRFRLPALITTKAVITLVMLAIGRSVFRPRLHSSLPVAAFSTAADLAPTPAGAAAAGGRSRSTALAAAVAAGMALAAGAARAGGQRRARGQDRSGQEPGHANGQADTRHHGHPAE